MRRPLNWNSLGISDFIDTCGKGIADFMSVLTQVKKADIYMQSVVDDGTLP